MSSSFPDFEQPPLDEVVMGIQFEPLKSFSAGHLGLYWQRVRDQYPHIQDNPPLLHQVELPEPVANQKTTLKVPLALRCWFMTEDKTQLIQLQRDHFIRNWRQVTGNEVYPRYPVLIDALMREWRAFLAFAKEENLGEVKVDQCELTYINQVPKGDGWESFAELGKVFTILNPVKSGGLLSSPEVLGWSGQYRLPEGRGRLYVEISPSLRGRDLKFVLTFNLKAHGPPAGASQEQVFAWFDLAHEWVVRGFAELTDPAMHARWKRRF